MDFHFQSEVDIERDSVIFAKINMIFAFNFVLEKVVEIYRYKEPLETQP